MALAVSIFTAVFIVRSTHTIRLAINRAQFNTTPPIHCIDSMLGLGMEEAKVSYDIPTTDSHVCQLYKCECHISCAKLTI